MPTSDLLDGDEIAQLATEMGDGAAEIFGDLIAALERDVEKSMPDMHAALDKADPERLRQAAHRLRGSFASLGAVKAASLCHELETIGAGGDISQAAPMVERLDILCSESVDALRELLQ